MEKIVSNKNNLQILFEDNHIIAINKRCGDIVQGDKTGDTLGGAILVGLIGKALTGQDDGAKIGALFGGIIGHDKSNAQSGTARVCQYETRYREKTNTVYSHSTITWRMNGRTYRLNFQK